MREFTGKAVVITGAGSGIGRGIAEAFAAAGANLVVAGIDGVPLSAAAAQLQQAYGAEVLPVTTDVSDPDAVESLAEAAYARFGSVAVLCNNAGVATMGAAWEQPLSDWTYTLGVNLYGAVHGIRAFVPRMLAHGEQAHIVNVSSMGGLTPTPQLAPYSASKAAVIGLSLTLREELLALQAPIGVSVVCPGGVKSAIMTGTAARYASGSLSKQAQENLDRLADVVTDGISGDEAGKIIFNAVRDNQFWVLPNAESIIPVVDDEYRELLGSLNL
ncbi:MAG: hypothetical protein JWR37_1776 [Mycobacterium sp.]|nr:hypothetical protein [Mycobacterium sp.]